MSAARHRNHRLLLAVAFACAFGVAPAHATTWKVIERFSDGCDEDVSIKKPYADAPSLDDGDVLLCRSQACKSLLGSTSQPAAFQGLAANAGGTTGWTPRDWLRPVPKNGDRYFRWFCGLTAERSRCDKRTDAISVRLKSPGAFETRCWDRQP
jgi:hypothetical protein